MLSTSQKMATVYGHIPNPDQNGAGLYSFKLSPASSLFLFSLAFILLLTILCWVRRKCTVIIEKPAKINAVRKIKMRTKTPASILDVKVTLPSIIIFRDEADMKNRYDPFEFAHVPAVRLGKGTLKPLYKVVLNNGSIVTVRKLQAGLAKPDEINRWIKFFGGIRDKLLSRIMFSFWYGGEAFIVYQYMCLGSLEELLHGTGGNSSKLIPILVPTIAAVILSIIVALLLVKRTSSKRNKTYTVVIDGPDGSEESVQIDFDTIRIAANDFSEENKIGQGGFGAIYKRSLSDGREIAVKRLSINSGQGAEEFMNEVA